MKQKIKLWMIGTKRTEFNNDLCTGSMSGIVILGIKKINKLSRSFKICVPYIRHLIFLFKDEHTTQNKIIYKL